MRLLSAGRATLRGRCFAPFLLLAALPFVVLPAAGDPLQAPRAFVVAIACALCAFGAAPPRSDGRSRLALAVVAALLGWLTLAAMAGGLPSAVWGVHGRFQGLVWWGLVFAAGAAGWVALHRDVRALAGWFSAAGALEAAYVLVVALVFGERAGTGGNQAVTAGWLAVSVALATAAGLASRSRARALYLGAASLMLIALGVLGSRGAWVGLAAAAGVLLIARRDRFAPRIVAALLAAAIVVVAALAAGGESASKLDPAALRSASGASRLAIWEGAGRMIADRPLLGVGPGRFLYVYQAYDPVERARREPGVRADQAHGLFVQLAVEGGIPAAALAVALAALALAAGASGIRSRDGASLVLAAGFAAYLGQGLFGVAAIETDALGWALAGAMLGRAAVVGARRDAARPARERTGAAPRAVLGAWSLALALAVSFYVAVDLRHGRGREMFEAADFASAAAAHRSAARANPLVDVYRVGVADAAAYLGPAAAREALGVVEAGLALEPASFDLALARARLLRTSGASARDVAEAYALAVSLYPHSIDAGREGAAAFARAGRPDEALRLAGSVLAVSPRDSVALTILRDCGP